MALSFAVFAFSFAFLAVLAFSFAVLAVFTFALLLVVFEWADRFSVLVAKDLGTFMFPSAIVGCMVWALS